MLTFRLCTCACRLCYLRTSGTLLSRIFTHVFNSQSKSRRYAAKMEHEGAAMYDAAAALRDAMIALRLACDGGKDSLSMAATAGGEVQLLHALPAAACVHWWLTQYICFP